MTGISAVVPLVRLATTGGGMSDDVTPKESMSGSSSEEAARAQRRLRDLLRANATIVERLDLEIVLRRIVEAAMALVDARFGALGVIAADGNGLERFIHVGIDDDLVGHIGHLPSGKGILGAVIADRAPIRLAHLSHDPRSVGFPDSHPPMDSFLGVPVRVGDQVYGNLYLTQGTRGPFRADDEELVVALAATAGIAIENARLYDLAKTREVWSTTTADVMAAMLEVTGDDVLDVIAEQIDALLDVDLVAVAIPYGADELHVTTARGAGADELRGQVFPAAGTLAARALTTRQAATVDGLDDATVFDRRPGLGPTVAIPLFSGDEPLGVLTLSRRIDAAAFTDADLAMAFAFAGQASVAIEIVRARKDRRRLDTTRDRARIARDLHDHVIQRLFGAGLALQAISAAVEPDPSVAIEEQVDVIDAAIKDIRTLIFAISASERGPVKRVRDQLLDVVSEMAVAIPDTPRITFAGPLDSLVEPLLATELVAVLRECLTNVVRHAHAHSVEITAAIADGRVTLIVADDGRGIPDDAVLSGLANIADRAALGGGRCIVTSRPGSGTRIEWSVPAHGDTSPEQP
ncbi:MAG: GAF domain-containing protein [Microbacterium sp.]